MTETIGILNRGAARELRVVILDDGNIDIREYEKYSAANLYTPTKSGVSTSADKLAELIAVLQLAEAKGRNAAILRKVKADQGGGNDQYRP